METEIFNIITKVNRLFDKVVQMESLLDKIIKSHSQPPAEKQEYCEEHHAIRLLHMSPSTLYRLRKSGVLPYIRDKRKILYRITDLHAYVERHLAL